MTLPVIQVVALKDKFLTKDGDKRNKSGLCRPQFKQFSAAQRAALLRNANINRIPMKRSPYLGYLRHAPCQKYQNLQNRFHFQSSMSIDGGNGYFSTDSFQKSSPYVGFMRHAPPSHCKVRSNSTSMLSRRRKGLNKSMMSDVNYSTSGDCKDTKEDQNTTKTGHHDSNDLFHMRYHELSKFVSGHLPGGSPLHSYYSLCKWLVDTERPPTSEASHYQDSPITTFEMFHKVASWFLFPVAYDQRSACFFYDMGDDANMEHVKRGFSLISSFIKRFLSGRDILLICTGLQIDSDSRVTLPNPCNDDLHQNDPLSSLPPVTIDDAAENDSGAPDTENEVLDSSSIPPNHPLHISVSSLAKAYHLEQAQSEMFNVYSSEDIADMSSAEIQRHLDIETILRLPTVTYSSPKTKKNHEDTNNNELETEIAQQTINAANNGMTKNGSEVDLEWSWISVPQDPQCLQAEFSNSNQHQSMENIKDGSNENKSDHNEHCVICLEQFIDGDRLRILPCEHRFHTSCIDKWLSGSYSHEDCFTGLCPTCKKNPNDGILSNNPSFDIGEDDSLGTMGEDMRLNGVVPSWAFARLGGSIVKESEKK